VLAGNIPLPPSQPASVTDKLTGEPIYECVIPREEMSSSPPPLPAPPQKLISRSPVSTRMSPLPQSRPTSRSSSTGVQTWRDDEKDQRRRFRVERKLQELEEDQEAPRVPATVDDSYHDIVEFAHNYFNSHERSPEGMIFIN